MSLLNEMSQKAFDLGVPISVHLDVTYRCNERCVHCYLDHNDHGEMTTAEIKSVLDQLAEAGVFFLTFSGGEVFLRRDFFELLPIFKLILSFNHKPVITDEGHGMWSRVRLVPFVSTIDDADKDEYLLDKLKAEGPGVLNWALDGIAYGGSKG